MGTLRLVRYSALHLLEAVRHLGENPRPHRPVCLVCTKALKLHGGPGGDLFLNAPNALPELVILIQEEATQLLHLRGGALL